MNKLIEDNLLYACLDDVVAFADVFSSARQLYPLNESFDQALESVRGLAAEGLIAIGTVDANGNWHRSPGDIDDQIEALRAAYREDPRDDVGPWLYLRWLQNTPEGKAVAEKFPETRIREFDIFYG